MRSRIFRQIFKNDAGILSYVREALIESECTDWQADFSPDEGDKTQEYCRISRFETKYGGKSAAKMGAAINQRFPKEFLERMAEKCPVDRVQRR